MSDTHPAAPPPDRRSVLKWATHGLGGLFGAVLGIPAIAYLIDARNRSAPDADFMTVARLSDLEKDVPFQAVVRAVRRDAWTLHPNDVIGRVWLIRRADDVKVATDIDAFTTICPHLGCSINFADEEQHFVCPCHNGTFDLTGERVELPMHTNPAPRGMDALDWRRDPKSPAMIQVKYVNYRQGEPTKEPKT